MREWARILRLLFLFDVLGREKNMVLYEEKAIKTIYIKQGEEK